jgi:HK97 gp10 family phage protein
VTEFVHVKGLKELQAQLDKLPANIEANILRGALRDGAKVMEADVKARVPVGLPSAENQRLYGSYTGALRDSVRITTRRSKNGRVSASVRAGSDKAWYWRFVEFGTAAHWIKPKERQSLFLAGLAKEVVWHPGARPQPFMRVSYDVNAAAAIAAVGEGVRTRLAKVKTPVDWSKWGTVGWGS